MTQLELKFNQKKKRTKFVQKYEQWEIYANLNINEKINLKSYQGGVQWDWFFNHYPVLTYIHSNQFYIEQPINYAIKKWGNYR